MPVHEITFHNYRGERLRGSLHWPHRRSSKSAVILCHGFVSDRKRRRFVRLGRQIAQKGVPALRFTFSGYGDSDGRFGDISYQGQVREVQCAMDFLARRGVRRFGILGHSMGGGVALLAMQRDRRVAAVVAVAPVVFPYETHRRRWHGNAWREFLRRGWGSYRDRRGREWRVPLRFLRRMEHLAIFSGMQEVHKPLLIIAAERDASIPLADLRKLERGSDAELTKLVVVRGAEHNFHGARDEARLLRESAAWFDRYLFADRVPVVNALLMRQGKILLMKRSQKLGTHGGFWHVVAGYLGDVAPKERALREIAEETGIMRGAVEFVRAGKAFPLSDAKSGKTFLVHPLLFTLRRPQRIRLDWEHTAHRWVDPNDLRRFRLIPGFLKNSQALGLR